MDSSSSNFNSGGGPFIPEQPGRDSRATSSDDEIDEAIQRNIQMMQMMIDDSNDEYMEHLHNVIMPQAVQCLHNLHQLVTSPKKTRGGSKIGWRYIHCNHVTALERLESNYFGDIHRFYESQFKNRFRVSRSVFQKIYAALSTHPLFVQKVDAAGKLGINPKIKKTAALRFLAYGNASDALDETFFLGTQTSIDALDDFFIEMNNVFGDEYLRTHNQADVSSILTDAEKRGWPGCLGSIDCTTWQWKNCPVEWVGQFIGKEKFPSVVLEAACTHDGWIWHSFFGPAGGFNDRTILQLSTLLHPYCMGKLAPVNYMVNVNPYNVGYYLAGNVYPKWACLVSAIKYAPDDIQAHFTKCQEAALKKIECAFGRLKRKWYILQRSARFHCMKVMSRIMYTCIILHNMVVHERCKKNERDYIPDAAPPPFLYPKGSNEWHMRNAYARNKGVGAALQADLIQHYWSRRNV